MTDKTPLLFAVLTLLVAMIEHNELITPFLITIVVIFCIILIVSTVIALQTKKKKDDKQKKEMSTKYNDELLSLLKRRNHDLIINKKALNGDDSILEIIDWIYAKNKEIYVYLQQNNTQTRKIQSLVNTILPTIIDLIKGYKIGDAVLKKDILSTLIKSKRAYEYFEQKIYENRNINTASTLKVFNTMLDTDFAEQYKNKKDEEK